MPQWNWALGQAKLGTCHQNISSEHFSFQRNLQQSQLQKWKRALKRPKRKSTHNTPCCEASEGILLRRKGLAGEEWLGSSLWCWFPVSRSEQKASQKLGLVCLLFSPGDQPFWGAPMMFKLLNSQCLTLLEASKSLLLHTGRGFK